VIFRDKVGGEVGGAVGDEGDHRSGDDILVNGWNG
jgi:hypothetical protein